MLAAPGNTARRRSPDRLWPPFCLDSARREHFPLSLTNEIERTASSVDAHKMTSQRIGGDDDSKKRWSPHVSKVHSSLKFSGCQMPGHSQTSAGREGFSATAKRANGYDLEIPRTGYGIPRLLKRDRHRQATVASAPASAEWR